MACDQDIRVSSVLSLMDSNMVYEMTYSYATDEHTYVFLISSGKCNETEARMPPYEDITPNGMVFELKDVNYTQDQGRFSFLIEYGAPEIETPIDVDVQGRYC